MPVNSKPLELSYLELIDRAAAHDKFYAVFVIDNGDGTYSAEALYGRRGSDGMAISKYRGPSLSAARAAANKAEDEKQSGGYRHIAIPSPVVDAAALGRAQGRLAPAGTKPARLSSAPGPSRTPAPAPAATAAPAAPVSHPGPARDAAAFAAASASPAFAGFLVGDGARYAVRFLQAGTPAASPAPADPATARLLTFGLGSGSALGNSTLLGEVAGGRFRVYDCVQYRSADLLGEPLEVRWQFAQQAIGDLTAAGQMPASWEEAKTAPAQDADRAGCSLRDLRAVYGAPASWLLP